MSGRFNQAVRLMVKFGAGLRRMRPYRENVPGSVYFAYDSLSGVLHIRDRGTDFYGLFGGRPIAFGPSGRRLRGYRISGRSSDGNSRGLSILLEGMGQRTEQPDVRLLGGKIGKVAGAVVHTTTPPQKVTRGIRFPGKRIGTLEKPSHGFGKMRDDFRGYSIGPAFGKEGNGDLKFSLYEMLNKWCGNR